MGTISSIGQPVKVRPEMIVRWLLSNVDKLKDLAIVGVMHGDGSPVVACSDKANPYLLAMASSLFNEMAMDGMAVAEAGLSPENEKDPT